MMKIKLFVVCCSLILSLFSFAQNGGIGKKTISNKLYNITVPADWVPMDGMKGDGSEPGERDIKFFHLYYWAWSSLINSIESLHTCIGVDIQSYQPLDGTAISVKDVEQLEMGLLSKAKKIISKTDLKPKANQRRFAVVGDSKEMDGSIVRFRTIFLIQRSGKITHCVKISLQESRYQSPEVKKMIKYILDSFVAK